MSLHSIHNYHLELEKIIHFGGTRKETAIRNAFYNLLNEYSKQKGLMLIPEITIKTARGKNVTPDGTLKDMLRLDWGYWESKDEADDINEEIKKKFAKDYPKDNILFEDSNTAVLYQNGVEQERVNMKDAAALDRCLNRFVNYERPEVKNFRTAIELFKQDIPKVTTTLHHLIAQQETTNPKYVTERNKFLKLCQDSINPDVTKEDVQEMMIQHILTEDIFNTIFDETQFHRENNIAHQLEGVLNTFFTGATRKNTLASVQHYYQAINATGAGIADHHEKQRFLKAVYEVFYKSYNPKAADRLGVVYTPNEIVKFMIESTDFLVHKYFGKYLQDKGVEILDPATGTGTFVCDMIDYFAKDKLEYKYRHELHANEVSILPYYISNLNIEFTYKQKTGQYAEFENLCFVDTLDNLGFKDHGKQIDMFVPFTEENSKRIKNQNKRKIAVVIGNPPYNANQVNENDDNKNREYPEIDKRIKETFVRESAAQKTKTYDMYSRFYRWAMDRIDKDGVIAFVTNNSFVKADGFDGFRKTISKEFADCYIIDLAGDYRTDKEENVFGIKVGVCIAFMIKRSNKEQPCEIKYFKPDITKANEKLKFLSSVQLKEIEFDRIIPDKKNQWLEQADNDFEKLLPLVAKKSNAKSIIGEYSNGVSTNRDEWVYDFSPTNLYNKMVFFFDEYNNEVKRWDTYKKDKNYNDIKAESNPVLDKFLSQRNIIKWSSRLKRDKLRKNRFGVYDGKDNRISLYRPFVKKHLHFGYLPIDLRGAFPLFFPTPATTNITLTISNSERVPLCLVASDSIADLNMFMPAPAMAFALYKYNEKEDKEYNITDWGLNQFTKHYGTKKIKKEDIFNYVYAVLHNPAYRKKYELNLKREFPRIPFYTDFFKWAAWGKQLMELHINYESVKPYTLQQIDVTHELKDAEAYTLFEKAKLKADKEKGTIVLDGFTTLTGIPPIAWQYKLGNRSALEWILDQYKETKPKDPTIAEKFNTYRFKDYKAQVINLLKRVCTVSVETMQVIAEMEKESA